MVNSLFALVGEAPDSSRPFRYSMSFSVVIRAARYPPKNGSRWLRYRAHNLDDGGGSRINSRNYFTIVASERTTIHLPSTFSKTSVHAYFPLVSFPLDMLFSVEMP